jgi:hypothetical protein
MSAYDVLTLERNPSADLTTIALLEERECWQWDLAEVDAAPERWAFAAESRGYIIHKLRRINDEIARRRRLAKQPSAPAWPHDPLARKEELGEIKRRLPLPEFIAKCAGGGFQQRGQTLWMRCPLPGHDDSTPSFHVDPRLDLWHCFGCGRGGDLFDFARHYLNINEFHKVAEVLAAEAGVVRAAPPQPASAAGSGMLAPDGSFVAIPIPAPRPRAFTGRRG